MISVAFIFLIKGMSTDKLISKVYLLILQFVYAFY